MKLYHIASIVACFLRASMQAVHPCHFGPYLRPACHHMGTEVEQLHSRAASLLAADGRTDHIDQAIVLYREALELCPPGHPERPASLIHLAMNLHRRYDELGTTTDLEEAVVLARAGVDPRPADHFDRWLSLHILGICLAARYEQLGAMEDLQAAIVFGREELSLCPYGHSCRPISLRNLAARLETQYEQLGTMELLNEVISFMQESLGFHPPGDSGRLAALTSLALNLSARYKQVGDIQDLNKAISLNVEANDLYPQEHPNRPMFLLNFALQLCTRYEQLGEMNDLNATIAFDREALALCPQEHHFRPSCLHNLALHLCVRFNKLRVIEDLDEAIIHVRDAFQLYPIGHPNRSHSLENLASYLHGRFTLSMQLADREELFSLYVQLVHTPQVVSSSDLSAARAWTRLAEDLHHPTILLAYETSLRLVLQHLATLPSLSQQPVFLRNLTASLAMDVFSAYLRNRSPTSAVEFSEHGWGVFWNQLIFLRSPLDNVIASGPEGVELADEFTRLASLIRGAPDSLDPDPHEWACRLDLEMQGIVTNIRKLPGLSRFLLPLLFSDLRHAANVGPIIILNASKYSCDALIVLLDRDPVHIPLRITQANVRALLTEFRTLTAHSGTREVTGDLTSLLRQLWDHIVSPIVDLLQTSCSSQSRIWWCPTGEFSMLPLHAAGPYREDRQNFADLYISSYAPTLSALIRARMSSPSGCVTERKRCIAIGQIEAAGENEFLVGEELDAVGQRVSGHATFTRVDGEESCTSRVVEELGKSEWVHLSCEGFVNQTQLLESGFALHDGYLTMKCIIGCELKNPEFAWLSVSRATDGDEEDLGDVTFLASALMFAGFRSVVGTMFWVGIGRREMVSTFYDHMVDESGRLDHTRAAFALNNATKSADIPLEQRIAHIHLGA